ncbi:cadmium resistance transporter [Dactylosporangium sp. NPDC050688]|uniref:cadmium resistance transporter n=1 Tax=Dactylosporangium sp. NPDC050688 TaxID=3157217 RepID=UPI0033E745FF
MSSRTSGWASRRPCRRGGSAAAAKRTRPRRAGGRGPWRSPPSPSPTAATTCVYVPVFATAGIGGMSVYVAVFLVLVAVWVLAGRYFATRPLVARALSRWGHVLMPVVLVGIGLLILIEGGAFGL